MVVSRSTGQVTSARPPSAFRTLSLTMMTSSMVCVTDLSARADLGVGFRTCEATSQISCALFAEILALAPGVHIKAPAVRNATKTTRYMNFRDTEYRLKWTLCEPRALRNTQLLYAIASRAN